MWKLKCAGCGTAITVTFKTWRFYFFTDNQPYLHIRCAEDMEHQRKLDGLE